MGRRRTGRKESEGATAIRIEIVEGKSRRGRYRASLRRQLCVSSKTSSKARLGGTSIKLDGFALQLRV